nr:hypothetical protein [Hydrogenovibrio sp. SC-1]
MHHCISYIDHRLEKTSSQTLEIAEMMIEDIKALTISYPLALKQNNLRQHAEKVRVAQMKWVNQLHDIIRDQNNHDLNSQMLQSIQTFMNTVNQNQLKQLEAPLANTETVETSEMNANDSDRKTVPSDTKSETHYHALLEAEVRAKGSHTTHH